MDYNSIIDMVSFGIIFTILCVIFYIAITASIDNLDFRLIKIHHKYINGFYNRLLNLWFITDTESFNKFIYKYQIDLGCFKNDTFYIELRGCRLEVKPRMDSVCITISELDVPESETIYILNPACEYEYLQNNNYSEIIKYVLVSVYNTLL